MSQCLLIVSAFYPPERGAAPSRIANTARQMNERGWDVKVVTYMPSYPTGSVFKEYKGKFTLLETLSGMDCKRVWSVPSNSNNPFVRVISMFTQTVSLILSVNYIRRVKPDLVLIQTPPLLSAFGMKWICRALKLPYIANVSDIWPLTALELGVVKKGFSYSIFEKMEASVYKGASGLVAQSEETQRYLNERTDKPILLYRNLPIVSEQAVATAAPAPSQPRKIVYAGLLGLAQNVRHICESVDFDALEVEFHIYGDGVQREAIAKIAHQKNGIHLHDSVHPEVLRTLLPDFDATIISLSSQITGAFPSKIYMALSVPLPIIYSGDGDGYRMIQELGLGWVSKAGDNSALLHNLVQFSKMPDAELTTLKTTIKTINAQHFNFAEEQDKLHHNLSQFI